MLEAFANHPDMQREQQDDLRSDDEEGAINSEGHVGFSNSDPPLHCYRTWNSERNSAA